MKSALVTAFIIGAFAPFAGFPPGAHAQDHSDHHPASGAELKTLAAEELEGYLTGEGMGFALAAELNSYPGPKHVLDSAEELEITAEQKERLEAILEEMLAEAVRLGHAVVEKERELDAMFAEREATATAVSGTTRRIAELEGELRAVHLKAHLLTTEVLTGEQIDEYNRLRGHG